MRPGVIERRQWLSAALGEAPSHSGARGPVPAVWFLSGLTCTDDNVRVKAGAQRYAADWRVALVMPDTSPRGADVPDEPERYDLGQGAGFYVNAVQEPWVRHYRIQGRIAGVG